MSKKKGPRKLGKTGKFPQGKLNEHDEGGLTYSVGIDQDKIIIDFNTPVAWLGLDMNAAKSLAEALLKKIYFLENEKES